MMQNQRLFFPSLLFCSRSAPLSTTLSFPPEPRWMLSWDFGTWHSFWRWGQRTSRATDTCIFVYWWCWCKPCLIKYNICYFVPGWTINRLISEDNRWCRESCTHDLGERSGKSCDNTWWERFCHWDSGKPHIKTYSSYPCRTCWHNGNTLLMFSMFKNFLKINILIKK